ncbi:nucleoprotein/polynucleotide-associated enzyme [Steroidobacter denitrificans]|uniref:Nucleoprotein/polynucleotide-associated enzyme n=1 Tax=Steroidobacter denitrificans TaxID=465721 RepID=A0A127FDY4_STEDE|nr:DUF2058 domain-containing protein [Steroidobacter denitrificans]AMN47908.1 nucleoprotein/polynucleotide-associated enzyme [Steroidobacter denitrificans]
MSMSLREQLLQAGLGSRKQAKQAEQQQYQRNKQDKNRAAAAERHKEQQRRAAQAQAAKAARDQELNRKRQEQAERKERWAQIKQLIEQHRVTRPQTDDYFNFIDRQKVRRMSVDAALREKLIAGSLVIVRCEGRYDVVPAEIAERIREREPRAVVALTDERPVAEADDPYKDFVVPDDLMW